MNATDARRKRAEDVAKRRNAQAACAIDFLVYADEGPKGDHAPRCVHGAADPCSRDYVLVERLEDEQMYEGTGIGLLYGLPGADDCAWQLAGWNVRRAA